MDDLVKTNVDGYSKSSNAVVATSKDALAAYKRRKKIFKNADDVMTLKTQLNQANDRITSLESTIKLMQKDIMKMSNTILKMNSK